MPTRPPLQCLCVNHFYRAGCARYICTECKKDITLELVLSYDIGHHHDPTHRKDGDMIGENRKG